MIPFAELLVDLHSSSDSKACHSSTADIVNIKNYVSNCLIVTNELSTNGLHKLFASSEIVAKEIQSVYILCVMHVDVTKCYNYIIQYYPHIALNFLQQQVTVITPKQVCFMQWYIVLSYVCFM